MARNHRKAAREAQLATASKLADAPTDTSHEPEKSGFGGLVSAILSIFLTVISSAMKDVRFLLWFVPPLVALAAWNFARVRTSKRANIWATAAGVISYVAVICGNYGLRPQVNQSALSVSRDTHSIVATSKSATRPPTLREIFNKDFPTFYGGMTDLPFTDSRTGLKHSIPARMLLDNTAHTRFLAVYLDGSRDLVEECRAVLYNIDAILKFFDGVRMGTRTTGDTAMRWSNTFVFSKTVYIYMAFDMALQQEATLDKEYAQQGLTVEFRGSDYFALHDRDLNFQQPADLPPPPAPPLSQRVTQEDQ